MSITLISYASREYRFAQIALNISAKMNGVDQCISYRRKDLIKTPFHAAHKSILDHPRGGGYWLWKPYFMLETLKSLPENAILIYADAGILFRKPITQITELVSGDQDVAVFYNDVKASDFVKRDAFIALNCDEPEYHNAPLLHAGLQVFRKTKQAVAYLEEVLKYCVQDGLITDAPNVLGKPNLPGFSEHRHDQSIFSLVALKKRLTIFADPTQYRTRNVNYIFGQGEIPVDPSYKSVAVVHRYKNLQMWRLAVDAFKKFRSGILNRN